MSEARSIRLILDWDGTLTVKDTMSILGDFAIQRDKRLAQISPTKSPPRKPLSWADFGSAYLRDYEQHAQAYEPSTKQRISLEAERKWLASLLSIEAKSAYRVEESGFFKGVTQQDIRRTAQNAVEKGEVRLRHGWHRLLLALVPDCQGWATPGWITATVLSVNWSATFIRQSISEHIRQRVVELNLRPREEKAIRGLSETLPRALPILANEIEDLDSLAGSSGMLSLWPTPSIRTSLHKRDQMEKVLKDKLRSELSVYVGDSATDLECLLAADIGICIRDDPLGRSQGDLAETLQRLQIDVIRLAEYSLDRKDCLWWATDFDEIMDLLHTFRPEEVLT